MECRDLISPCEEKKVIKTSQPGYLKMRATEATANLSEKRNHTVLEFCCLSNLLRTIYHRRILEEAPYHCISQHKVSLYELDNAVRELLMIHGHTIGLVKGNQETDKKQLVLFLQWQCKAIDYAPENFQHLCNSITPLCLKNELVEDIIDGFPNERWMYHKFTVNPVKNHLQTLPLPFIPGIEQVKQSQDEGMVNESLGMPSICFCGSHKS